MDTDTDIAVTDMEDITALTTEVMGVSHFRKRGKSAKVKHQFFRRIRISPVRRLLRWLLVNKTASVLADQSLAEVL